VRAVICCLFEVFDPKEVFDAAANLASFCEGATDDVIPFSDLLLQAFQPPAESP
jgi:hypothetical protein